MAFEQDGFFSPELEQFRHAIRTTHPTKPWFDYAMDCHASTPKTENALFAMHGLFVRAHQTFQGALLLIARGLIGDARTLVRSGVEGAIAIHALSSDPSFIDRLIEAHYINQRKVARVLLDNPDYLVR